MTAKSATHKEAHYFEYKMFIVMYHPKSFWFISKRNLFLKNDHWMSSRMTVVSHMGLGIV